MVSKKLSWLLRHGAEKEGLKLGWGGYANLEDVLQNRNVRSLQPRPTLAEVRDIVAENAKQRFSLIHISSAPSEGAASESASTSCADLDEQLKSDTDPSHYLIRANQGHSLKLESGADDLLTPITTEAGNLPQVVVHGTRREHWPKIAASGGLKLMGRNHVHFAAGVPQSFKSAFGKAKSLPQAKEESEQEVSELPEKKNAPLVLSGMRETSNILMFLDLNKAMEAGLKFFLSENGVVLCEGDEKGLIGLEFFERVEDRDGKVLVEKGIVVGQTDVPKWKRDTEGHGPGKGLQNTQTLPIRDKEAK